jgi:hypothetical protein
VRDTVGNPVKGATVTFSKTIDTSGGSLEVATAISNSSGLATTSYISGPNSAASNGVAITATVAGSILSLATNITVAQQALFVNLGFSNLLIVESSTQYSKEFSVSVTDASGTAVAGANVNVVLQPNSYSKGQSVLIDVNRVIIKTDSNGYPVPGQIPAGWAVLRTASCANEDANFNGQIETGEDFNQNGRLDPGIRPNIIQTSPGAKNTTDPTGFITYKMTYLKQDAEWSSYNVVASTATANGGGQGIAQQIHTLRVLATDVNNPSIEPPNRVSPFGYATSCDNPN